MNSSWAARSGGYLVLALLAVAHASSLSYDGPVIIRAKDASAGRDTVGEFGDKFRKAREKKDISLDDVSNVTKIGSRMLRAIEEEHFDQLLATEVVFGNNNINCPLDIHLTY